jgi:hypothetical protein
LPPSLYSSLRMMRGSLPAMNISSMPAGADRGGL